MRYFGIDYGDKRIGVALSDERGVFAFPLAIVENNERAADKIKKICSEQGVEKIIIGLPLSFSMKETEQTGKTRVFAKKLERLLSLPVEFENEILTSRQAQKQGVQKENIDKVSAALILQSWMDRKR